MTLRLLTFGPPTVRDGDATVAGAAAQPRRLALLAMLARAGDRGVTRDRVVSVLWPDEEDDRARRNLTHAIYALRRDLGNDEAIVGANDLRLNPEFLTTDVDEFSRARKQGDHAAAAALYAGPFLDGFHLPASGEFERWAERERRALAEEASHSLESLATAAESEGDREGAVQWWRRLAGHDPHDARVAVRLMRALAAAGDLGGALRHAKIYESLVAQDLELPPDPAVVSCANELREGAPAGLSTPVPLPGMAMPPVAPADAATVTRPNYDRRRPRPTHSHWPWWVTGTVVVLIGVWGVSRFRPPPPVFAVGAFTDHRADSSDQAASTIRDLLATNLARGRDIRILSTARLYELIPAGTPVDPGALTRAARSAGATELIDGALFRLPDGRLRLDLRRVMLADGDVRQALSVEGSDPYVLVDTGTARLLASFGQDAPVSPVADVTTRSLEAYRLYEQGLRRYAASDPASAEPLFAAALAEDSTFALAAYYLALSTGGTNAKFVERFRRALELAKHASERDRLVIEVDWANAMSDPALGPIADSLRARYPTELLGHLYAGHARIAEGRFAEALEPYQYAFVHDSAQAGNGSEGRCVACEALAGRITAFTLLDSIAAAVVETDRWIRLQPRDAVARIIRADLLVRQGQLGPAFAELDRAQTLDRVRTDYPIIRGRFLIHAGRLAEAESVLRGFEATASPRDKAEIWWNLALAKREAGDLPGALQYARQYRQAMRSFPGDGGAVSASAQLEAQLLMEAGRPRASASLFDSIAHAPLPSVTPSARARTLTWGTVHEADALAIAGDTALLAVLADSIERVSTGSGFARDRRLHHHVRGLLALARGDSVTAEAEFRAAVYSWTDGYTRTNLFLARLLVARGAEVEARQVLEAGLRGAIDGSSLYVARREFRGMLAALPAR